MKFFVDADTGDSISGWVVLDNPSATPSFIVQIPGRAETRFDANVVRPDIRDVGMSATDRVGFNLNVEHVADLPELADVTILEAGRGLPIYRRFTSEDKIEKRFYLFDAAVIPQQHIYEAIEKRFALAYRSCERYGLETIISLLTNPTSESMFAAGKLGHRYDYFLTQKNFIRAALLREPHEDLAERLLLLSLAVKTRKESVIQQYFPQGEQLLDFVRDLSLDNPRQLRAAFGDLPERQRDALLSPVTRTLACDFGEPPREMHIATALDNLATLDLVGTREHFGLFKDLLSEIAGVDLLGDCEISAFGQVRELAETLKKISAVADLIHEDLALYALVTNAIEEGRQNVEQNQ
ncbi:hypothetical protein [Methylocystis heyeri]|uniref:Uncharacterized protein n=1 Tax=Methylocystis heyeri TaxID=391905 RepID=A0A6B8KHM4_9HYPH|nr:hypothetical protein [Methylocystis heyeri]QGM46003.1 hypothetical protein H2LOC_009980 [Methylocystis heyeri]